MIGFSIKIQRTIISTIFNIYRDKFILSPLNLCDLTYSKYTPIEILNKAIFSRLEKFQLLIFWKRLSYKSCNFANFLSNIGGAGFFQFFPASKAIKDTDRIKLLRLSAKHIVLPVSNHDGMRQICNPILLQGILDNIAFLLRFLSMVAPATKSK